MRGGRSADLNADASAVNSSMAISVYNTDSTIYIVNFQLVAASNF